jgi:5-(carboxyamino)imidazole ribonucleotide mutase
MEPDGATDTKDGRMTRADTVARIVALALGGSMASFGIVILASWMGAPLWLACLLALTCVVAMGRQLFGRRAVAPPRPSDAGDDATIVGANAMREVTVSDKPLVGIIMGSQSDMAVMQECASQLEAFRVPHEILVASAHRQPEKVREWAAAAADRGMMVIIAAAGKAAHLGGVVAAHTPLPVITVPMKTSDLGGLDSLLSMVQMPAGVPVACVAINGAKNAAILATQILGASLPDYREAVVRMKADLAEG